MSPPPKKQTISKAIRSTEQKLSPLTNRSTSKSFLLANTTYLPVTRDDKIHPCFGTDKVLGIISLKTPKVKSSFRTMIVSTERTQTRSKLAALARPSVRQSTRSDKASITSIINKRHSLSPVPSTMENMSYVLVASLVTWRWDLPPSPSPCSHVHRNTLLSFFNIDISN